MMITFNNVSKSFGSRVIFKNFSYTFPKTGLVAIVGESGSGKTTLLNLISGLDRNYSGDIKVLGKSINKNTRDNLRNCRIKNIGYVFQNFNLLNLDTVFNNVYLSIDSISNDKSTIKKLRTFDSLKTVGLEKFSKKKVNKLSGGEKQRVAIARAIVNDPPIILCDEPTGALDDKNGKIIFDLLKRISVNKLVVVVTHDVDSIKDIASVIIELKNQQFTIKNQRIASNIDKLLLVQIKKKKRIPRVSLRFKIIHSLNKMKSKKYRTLILNFMLSLSLTGVGLSIIISNSVSTKINEAFKSILNGNQIVLSLKNDSENTFTNVYSAAYERVYSIKEKYDYLLEGIGVNYMVNFEDFFKDKNSFYISSTINKIDLASYSTRSINDFRWITDYDDSIYYPTNVENLDDDQIVLGLTYEDMVSICYQLHIQRNFTSLGHYIYEKGLQVALTVENSSWEYDDEQIFDVLAVCQTNEPRILHTNNIWNEIVFEEMMRLPSDDDGVHVYPWEMEKLYYLATKEDPSIFLDAGFVDETLDDIVFERANFNYNPSLCKYGDVCDEKRIYVYIVDKNLVSPNYVENIQERGIKNCTHYYISDYGYASYSSNLFSGFSKNVFLSNEDELIDKAIDADTQINNETNLLIDLPENVIQGNFINSMSNGLRFSSKIDNLKYGRLPNNLNEIVISEGVAKTFDKNTLCLGKYLSFAGEIKEFIGNDNIVQKEYNTTKLLVVGVTSETKNYIYHKSNWTISFFRDKLGVSNFLLIPRAVVFEFGSAEEANSAFEILEKDTQNYKAENPLKDLNSNIESTLNYANTILIAFSILSTVISILLLGTVLMLNIIESKDEIRLFEVLGIRKKDTNSIFTVQGLLQGLIAFSISTIELIFVDFGISYVLGDYLNIGFQFKLNPLPVFIIFLMSITIPFLVSKIMLLILGKTKLSHR